MRITSFFITICLLTIAGAIHAQPDSLWSRTYGGEEADTCRSGIVTADGGFALAGGTASFGNGSEDFYLVKTDADGEVQWTQTYGGDGWEQCQSVIQTNDGGYALAGMTIPVDSTWREFMLVRTNAEGEELWSQRYSHIFNDDCQKVIQTNDGGFAMIGLKSRMDLSDAIWLIKTDEDGEVEWEQTFACVDEDAINVGMSLLQTDDGDFALLGLCMVWGDEGLDESLSIFMMTDDNGDSLWAETYVGEYLDQYMSFVQTDDGGFAMVGLSGYDRNEEEPGMDDVDFVLHKVDSMGETEWYQTYGTEDDLAMGFTIVQTDDGGFVLGGMIGTEWGRWGPANADLRIIRTDHLGEELWSRTFGGENEEWGGVVLSTEDGGYAIIGSTNSFGEGECDFWLVKTGADPVSVPKSSDPELPEQISLLSAYPNPFNSTTTINYIANETGMVYLGIYDLSGQLIEQLVSSVRQPGQYSVNFTKGSLPSGMYIVKMQMNSESLTTKVLLLR